MTQKNKAVGAPLETPVMQHTPGPWYVSASGPTVYALHGNPERNRFSAQMQAGRRDDATLRELNANAKLVAAAPDMLAALRGLLALDDDHQRGSDDEDVCAEVRAAWAALAKATGAA